MEEKDQVAKALTIREKITIHLIIALIKVVKPFSYQHELDSALEEVYKLLKEKL